MGKPRLILLIRHAQSEGNKNREIHQLIPDHRVKLTDEGWKQAEAAGRRLRSLLKPTDTLQIYTSPYRRTRETTEGILSTLTKPNLPSSSSDDADQTPPFERSKIKVYEEPRIREQDFGNFQPCSAEMERMWRERADYGHFFYRIPNGESAADAYDRISGFNESLWRQFGEDDFASVCVLVTHGLMTRVFLMKWYHWSVEYFEDLRNVNHCEFVNLEKSETSGKFVLQNKLRTWSELKKERAERELEEQNRRDPQRRNTLSAFLKQPQESPGIPTRKWGGCPEGCEHGHEKDPRRKEKLEKDVKLPPSASSTAVQEEKQTSDHPAPPPAAGIGSLQQSPPERKAVPSYLLPDRDGGGTTSGANTPHEMSDDEEYFVRSKGGKASPTSQTRSISMAMRRPQRKPTPDDIERWTKESGMGRGLQADALGDEPPPDVTPPDYEQEEVLRDSEGEYEGERKGAGAMDDVARGPKDDEIEVAEAKDKSLRESVY